MKKIIMVLVFGILVLSLFSFVIAENSQIQAGNNQEDDSGNSNNEDIEGNELVISPNEKIKEENQGLGQEIRNKVRAGVYTNEAGEQLMVSEMAQNRIRLKVGDVEADCGCELIQEQVQNRTRLKAKLSNGKDAEIKVMPDSASEKALQRLRLKVCSEENNCGIELKEVGQGEKIQFIYELQAQRHFKILGMFKTKAQVKAQVDSENGEIVKVKKPWWSFLASESEE